MTKFQSLVLLTQSMTLSEKKAFRIKASRHKSKPDYIVLYNFIGKNQELKIETLQIELLKKLSKTSFETSVKYLYDLLLESMLDLRRTQDSYYSLFNKILKARILYEKSLFDECFELLEEVMVQGQKHENYHALLLASRFELEYLLALNFPDVDEKTLLKKQFRLTEILNYLRKINEQSSLYGLLKHRIVYKGHARSEKQKEELNDLVFSEISIVASLSLDNFEISKQHQLFQSNYLISVGDYQSALNSYYELNNLFETNKHLWSSPPIYYLHTLEGVLESLRSIHNYDGMTYFVNQLKTIDHPSADFRINLTCIIFLYELFPLLDRGDFVSSNLLMENYKDNLFDNLFALNLTRQAELCLYTSLIYFGNSEFHKAHKFLNQIILKGKNYYFLPVFRTIRLVNLMILYKLGDFDLIKYEIRSIKRALAEPEKGNKIERFLLKFLSKKLPISTLKRKQLWTKIEKEFDEIRHDVFEQQLLIIFDFTAWVESLIWRLPLSEILQKKWNE